jgi:glycosyltransferase involved in cell wall biosynthesis
MPPASRILFDLSTTLRWSGPPVGILRVEGELARWGRAHLPGFTLVFFDPATQRHCEIKGDDAEKFIFGDAVIDTVGMIDPGRPRERKTDRIPAALRPLARWILQFRHTLLQSLERRRLTASPPRAALIDRIQRRCMSDKYRAIMVKDDGTRRAFVPPDMVIGAPVAFRAGDILVCAGAGWAHTNIEAIKRQKAATPFRFAVLCYDIIPILFPNFYKPQDAADFRRYFDAAFAASDLAVLTSRRVEADVRDYCAGAGIPLAQTAVVPLGSDIVRAAPDRAPTLPAGLEAGRYALLISTIEPRKGHRLLAHVWHRLLDEGVPQATGFKLVFVGRPGWMVDELMRELADSRFAGSLHVLDRVDDRTMAALYRGAAFCLYPSAYEGYGLPIVESFRFGKAVLASTGGAVPEVAGDFSPCLDPQDEEAWRRTLKLWIEDPAARAPYEAKIRIAFKHPTWDEAAAIFFARLTERLPAQ